MNATKSTDRGDVMIRKRVASLLAIAATSASIGAMAIVVAPTAAAEQRIPLANGLTVILQDPGPDGSRSVRTVGRTFVGEYVINEINVRVAGQEQFERNIDAANDLSDTFILSRDQVDVSIQGCRDFSLPDTRSDRCGDFAAFRNEVPQQAEFLPTVKCNPPENFEAAEVPAGQQCKPKPQMVKCEPAANFEAAEVQAGQQCVPKPPKKCPEGSVKAEVPPAENCAAPTNTVTMNIGGGALQRTVTVTNNGPLGGTCAYDAKGSGLIAPDLSRQINVGPNDSTSIDVPAPPIGSNYEVTLACTGTYDGKQVEFGRVVQNVSSF
jgi:hypothetical protein